MAVYATVIMVILAIVMTVFIILSVLKEDSNNKKNQHNIIYPFNAKIQSRDSDHEGSHTVTLLTSDGKDQLQCPVGTHIEIIGAWTDVVDPNGICSNKPSATFKMSCGFADDQSAGVTCQDPTDCAPGMTCSGSRQCVPQACNLNSDCGTSFCGKVPDDSVVGQPCDNANGNGPYTFVPNGGLVCINGFIHKDPSAGQCLYCDTSRMSGTDDDSNVGYCAQSPSCANLSTNAQNITCVKSGCVPRDASAYLASICDGKRTCTMPGSGSALVYDPTKNDIFGPKPCNIGVDWAVPAQGEGGSGGGNVSIYERLPVAAGWGGGQPGSGQYVGTASQPSTYSQGFYCHGIFSCQPDST